MYEELKETLIKTLRTELAEVRSQSAEPVDTDAIKQLLQTIAERQEQIREDLGTQISEIDEKVAGMEIPEELPPRMVQHRFSFSLDATRNFWLFMSMFVVIAVQSVGLYLDWRPDRDRYDNDLKYRYVLMKGEASPKRLSELEELFEVERNQWRIFRKIRIAPALGPLHKASGLIPHPQGEVSVAYERTDGGPLTARISIPNGTTGVFVWNGCEYPLAEGM